MSDPVYPVALVPHAFGPGSEFSHTYIGNQTNYMAQPNVSLTLTLSVNDP